MSMNMIHFRLAVTEDFPAMISLLSESNLPVSDIVRGKQLFVVAEVAKQLVGCAGLEVYGERGLFRSLAVRPENQNLKIGKDLVAGIVALSKENNIKQLYLLTTTADSYFKRMVWQFVERTEVPEDIRASSEFSSVCPSTAICMMYPLS